jgi:hypothetical protein
MSNASIAKKWQVDPKQTQVVWGAMAAKKPVEGRLFALNIQTMLDFVDPKDARLTLELGERERQDGATLVIDPVIIAIIFGVLSLVATVLAPALKPLINQIIAFLNTILPMPLPPIA